jgi:hypothetical protein
MLFEFSSPLVSSRGWWIAVFLGAAKRLPNRQFTSPFALSDHRKTVADVHDFHLQDSCKKKSSPFDLARILQECW